MLSSLTRKLCPLMTLAMTTMGCGKKIAETEAVSGVITQPTETSTTYTIRYDGKKNGYHSQIKPSHGLRFWIPQKIDILAGSTGGRTFEITYNLNEYDSDYYDFRCIYIPSEDPSEMELEDCFNEKGSFGDGPLHYTFTIGANEIIDINVTGGNTSDLIADISFLLD